MGPDFRVRLGRLRGMLKEGGIDAAVLSSPRDIFYYTGCRLTGDFALLLVEPGGKPLLLVSCLSNYARELKTARVKFFSEFGDIKKELCGYKSLGFDEKNMSAEFFLRLKKAGLKLKPFCSGIKKPRMVKDAWELGQMRKAIKVTEDIFRQLKLTGRTEKDVAGQIEDRIIGFGLEKAFPPIVASGRNSSYIHYLPGRRIIKERDLVIVDMGVRFNGYCSDMTRTFCRRPDSRQKKLHMDILDLQGQIIDNARAGVGMDALERFSEGIYKKMGYRKLHAASHGLGLSVHERPSGRDTISEGMVFTVEPGAYIRNWGGCRIEDVVHVKNNRAKLLTNIPGELTH